MSRRCLGRCGRMVDPEDGEYCCWCCRVYAERHDIGASIAHTLACEQRWLTQPNPEAGAALREEGIARAEANAPEDWNERAYAAIIEVAKTTPFFTTDPVWEKLGDLPPEPRAMGGVVRRARVAGIIEPTDEFRETLRAPAHRSPIRVWRSLLLP